MVISSPLSLKQLCDNTPAENHSYTGQEIMYVISVTIHITCFADRQGEAMLMRTTIYIFVEQQEIFEVQIKNNKTPFK